MKLKIAPITLVLTGLIIAVGVVVYAAIPWLLDAYIKAASVPFPQNTRNTMLTLLYFVGIPVLAMLCCGFRISYNISKERSFIKENVKLMNIISICSASAGVMFFIVMFFLHSIFPVVIFVIFAILALFTRIFAQLFASAIAYKEENELTI